MLKEEMLPIKVVAQRTGLTQHVIRIWEKRYKAVSPRRSDTNRRFYSAQEVTRLLLLRQAIQNGFAIGHIAQLSDLQLSAIIQETTNKESLSFQSNNTYAQYLEECLLAIYEMDTERLDQILTKAQVELSPQILIESLIIPLLTKIGDLWQLGRFRIVQEHFASAVIRNFLGRLKSELKPSQIAPKLIVATPTGQLHELGALIVALVAAYQGWNVIYLGSNLPSEELAKAVEQHKANTIGLSIIHPSDDPYLHLELKKLPKLFGKKVTILVGGQAAIAYQNTLNSINGFLIDDLNSLRIKLTELRNANRF
jgi:MerR family transcriptional regulator, light-induced transcriptional regulator